MLLDLPNVNLLTCIVMISTGALGFPQGGEARTAGVGNLGLQDQRQALRWVQKYIGAFGGDKNRVTLYDVLPRFCVASYASFVIAGDRAPVPSQSLCRCSRTAVTPKDYSTLPG